MQFITAIHSCCRCPEVQQAGHLCSAPVRHSSVWQAAVRRCCHCGRDPAHLARTTQSALWLLLQCHGRGEILLEHSSHSTESVTSCTPCCPDHVVVLVDCAVLCSMLSSKQRCLTAPCHYSCQASHYVKCVCLTQYAEARCFQTYMGSGRVISPTELENVERDEWVFFTTMTAAHNARCSASLPSVFFSWHRGLCCC